MLLQRIIFTVVLSISALAVMPAAQAQHIGFFGKSDDNSDFTGLYDPFCDLDTCWFEPISCDCTERPMNSGWFFGYRRTNMNISRPRNEEVSQFYDPFDGDFARPDDELLRSIYSGNIDDDFRGDWSWGNRFDFGWMSEEGSGLWFVARKQDSPEQRLTFTNVDQNLLPALRLDNTPFGPTTALINGLEMYGFEANKVWRLAPTARGTVMEPFIGPRYIRLRDSSDRNDIFSDFFETVGTFPLTGQTVPIVRRVNFAFRQTMITTDNDLFGGQFGMRSRWRRGRWQVSSDVRGLMFWNHQSRERIDQDERQAENFVANFDVNTNIAAVNSVNGVVILDSRQTHTTESHNTFAYGGELNLELAFEVTQGFAITAGAEVIAIGDGVGRGFESVDDSLVMSGFSLGFTYNR